MRRSYGFWMRWCTLVLVVVMILQMLVRTWVCNSQRAENCKACTELQASNARLHDVYFRNTIPNNANNNTRMSDVHEANLKYFSRRVGDFLSFSSTRPDGWVIDCVTGGNKWPSIRSNLTLREFTLSKVSASGGESAPERRKTFQKIFHKRDWPANDTYYSGLKASGPGAILRNAQGAVAVLHNVVTMLKVHLNKSSISLLDIPCGDMQWMSTFVNARSDVEYTGADVVPELIEHHRMKYTRMWNARFVELDIVETRLNQSFDLILCRDMLQHLWIVDAMKALYQFSVSGSRYLLVTTFVDTAENEDVEKTALGGRRSSYNLEREPFSLERPLCATYDWNIEHLGLWPLPLKQIVHYVPLNKF